MAGQWTTSGWPEKINQLLGASGMQFSVVG